MKPTATKLNQFKYFVRRMDDLTQKNQRIRGKASELEKQMRHKILQVCCEELTGRNRRFRSRRGR